MLTAIIAVTLSVPDLSTAQAAYVDALGYRVADEGVVSQELADGWNAPRIVGRRYALLLPASGAPTGVSTAAWAVCAAAARSPTSDPEAACGPASQPSAPPPWTKPRRAVASAALGA